MKKFEFTIRARVGIHARPAAHLNKLARSFDSQIKIYHNDRIANVKNIMELMMLGVHCGERVQVTIEGMDEEDAFEKLTIFFKDNL